MKKEKKKKEKIEKRKLPPRQKTHHKEIFPKIFCFPISKNQTNSKLSRSFI